MCDVCVVQGTFCQQRTRACCRRLGLATSRKASPQTFKLQHPPPSLNKGKLHFFRYTFDKPPYATAGVLDAAGRLEAQVPLDLPRPVMMVRAGAEQRPVVSQARSRPRGAWWGKGHLLNPCRPNQTPNHPTRPPARHGHQ